MAAPALSTRPPLNTDCPTQPSDRARVCHNPAMAANTPPQSKFFKLPLEIRISVYEYILLSFRGPNTKLIGPLSPGRQMSIEFEDEMTRAIYRNLPFAIEVIQSDFNKQQCPPLKVNLLPYTEGLKHDAITLDLALPNSAFTSSWNVIQFLHRSIFPPLSRFNLACLSISFFDDDAYNQKGKWLAYLGTVFEYHFLHSTYLQRYPAPPPVRLQDSVST